MNVVASERGAVRRRGEKSGHASRLLQICISHDGDALHFRAHALQLAPLVVHQLARCCRSPAILVCAAPRFDVARHFQLHFELRCRSQQPAHYFSSGMLPASDVNLTERLGSAANVERAQGGRVGDVGQQQVDAADAVQPERLKPREGSESCDAFVRLEWGPLCIPLDHEPHEFEVAQLAHGRGGAEAHKGAGWQG